MSPSSTFIITLYALGLAAFLLCVIYINDDVVQRSHDVTHPQCHAITLATETAITKNTNPPMMPPIRMPTFFSSDESSLLLGIAVDNGVLDDAVVDIREVNKEREVNFMAVVVTEDDGLTVGILTTFVVVTVAKLKQ